MPYRKVSLALVLLALALPAGAAAHARLVGAKPADGAVLATAPADVRLLFDDQIRPAGGDLAVDAHGRSVLGGKPRRQGSRVLVVPLRPGLAKGSYTVRWRVISNDGHLISGVVAFGIGTKPVATLTAGGDGPSAWAVLLRLLLLGGLLAAGGAALTGRLLEAGRLETLVVGVGLALAAAGGFGLLAIEPGAASTRFGHFTEATAIVAAAGAGAAVLSLALPALGLAAWAAAAVALAGRRSRATRSTDGTTGR